MVKPDIDTLLAELAQYVADDLPPAGEGWFTVSDIMKCSGQTRARVYRRLEAGVDKGEIEKWKAGSCMRGHDGYYRTARLSRQDCPERR